MSISSISDFEYAQIIGHFNQLTGSGDFEKKLKDRGYTDAMIEEFKKTSKGSVVTRSLNLEFTTTEKITYPLFDYTYTLYDAYERRGTLPFEGPLVEQPAKIMEIFSVLKSLEFEREKRTTLEAEREAKRKK